MKLALLVGVVPLLLGGHIAAGTIRSTWTLILTLVGITAVITAFPTTKAVYLGPPESFDPAVVTLKPNFELVTVVGLIAAASTVVAGYAWLRGQRRRGARRLADSKPLQARSMGLPVTIAAFLLAILSEDVWRAAYRLSTPSVGAVCLLVCLLALYLSSRDDDPEEMLTRLFVVIGLAVVSFAVFYASGFLLVNPQTAVEWTGIGEDFCSSYCSSTITELVGGTQARIAGLFAAVSLLATADAESLLPPRSTAESEELARERVT